jgi:ribosomal protein S18 acetylase RimI-like enzyme
MSNTPTLSPFPQTETDIPIAYEVTSDLQAVSDFMQKHIPKLARDFASILILTGDRRSCCDEAILAKDENQEVVGVCTLSAQGEGTLANARDMNSKTSTNPDFEKFKQENWHPTIVGRAVLPAYRRQKIGENLYLQGINRLRKRMEEGQIPKKKIRIDHVSVAAREGMKKLLEKYPELSDMLEIQDHSFIF